VPPRALHVKLNQPHQLLWPPHTHNCSLELLLLLLLLLYLLQHPPMPVSMAGLPTISYRKKVKGLPQVGWVPVQGPHSRPHRVPAEPKAVAQARSQAVGMQAGGFGKSLVSVIV
jgi:hypothetical protein